MYVSTLKSCKTRSGRLLDHHVIGVISAVWRLRHSNVTHVLYWQASLSRSSASASPFSFILCTLNPVTIVAASPSAALRCFLHCWHKVRGVILHKLGAFVYSHLFHCHSGLALGGERILRVEEIFF